MWGVVLAGTPGWLLISFAASVAGALLGAALHWSEPAIYVLQMAGPAILVAALLASAAADRFARRRERQNVYRVRHDRILTIN